MSKFILPRFVDHRFGSTNVERRFMQQSKVRVEMTCLSATVKAEHEKHIRVMESAGAENWTESLRINKKVVTFQLDTITDRLQHRGQDSVKAKLMLSLDIRYQHWAGEH